jgi:mRNA interferase HigB
MWVISRKTLRDFWKVNKDAEQPLRAWFNEAEKALWTKPSDIKKVYKSCSILKKSRVVFNIAGNKYRLIVLINYAYHVVYIRFIGNHKQYDKIDADTI